MVKNNKEYMKKYNKKYKTVKTKNIKEYMKKYKSTDAFKRRRRENLKYYICECGGRYDSEHKNSHIKSKKHQKYNNKVLLEIIDELLEMKTFIFCEYTEKILDDLDKVEEGCFFDTDDDFLLNEEPLELEDIEDFEDIEDIEDFDISDFEDLEDYDIF